ncbi:spermidine synthase [Legionella shakespearei]|uniref:Spermidine synthase n=1 Tax=Legionella shakespearei DSM 23087 TaxID=1122169 RepID=A0A0W0YV79_9GAMM|nr:hypothetical protein [Legionella shakespearei]KTD60816.1 spermidine synthase [Legionella shakespearei DSM 23087]
MWKIRLGTCIYTSPSGYKVFQNYLYRWLTFGSQALQTVINRRYPYKPVLYYLPALTLMARHVPGECCLLGLGGAGIPHLLNKKNPNQSLVAVDNSEEVIEIARQFFMLDRISNLTLVHENAEDYVCESQAQFHHVIVDLYDANYFPADCRTDEFFMHCKNRLAPDGILAVNLANITEQWTIFQLIKRHFKATLVIPVKKSANMVILAAKNDDKELFIEQVKASGEIKKVFWVESWGYATEMKR